MKIKLLILAMLFGLSASAQFTNFNPYGVQKANAGDSVRLVGSSTGQYLNLPTTKMLRSAIAGISVDTTVIATRNFVAKPAVINDIYNKNSFYNLNDFDANGSFSVANQKIIVPADAPGQLSLSQSTGLGKYVLNVIYKSTSGTSSTGLGIGFISQNTAAPISHYVYIVESGINVGKIALHSTIDNQTTYSASALTYTPGDIINVTIIDNGNINYTITALDVTTGQLVTHLLNIGTGGTGQAFLHNTAKPSILRLENSTAYEISMFRYASQFIRGGSVGFGDSITQGFNATTGTRWTDQIGIQNAGGSGDRTADLLLRVNEIINVIKPKTVYLAIGTNDSDFSTFQANYTSLVNILESNGIRVVKLTPIANNNTDMTAKRNWIVSTYPTSSVDLFTPTKVTPGTGLNPAYDGGDGTHPNTAGHTLMANTITNSGLFNTDTYLYSLSNNFYVDYPTKLEFSNTLDAYAAKSDVYSKTVIDGAFANINNTFSDYVRKDLSLIGTGGNKISGASDNTVALLGFNRNIASGAIFNNSWNAFVLGHYGNLNKLSIDVYNSSGGIVLNDALSVSAAGAVSVARTPLLNNEVTRKIDLDSVKNSLSGYQTLANLSSVISPSPTLYPSNTAVINYLTANYAKQGGNSFGAPMVIGTSDANDVSIIRNGFEALKLSTTATFNVPIIATATAYKESGFINTLQSNTLTANVNTYLPADGGTLINNGATGWANYADNAYTSASPFTITSGTTSTLPNNAATVINYQIPAGVTSLYNPATSKITPQNDGDYYVTTIRFKGKTTAPTAGYLDFGIDIGGALGVQFKETKIFAKGAGIEHNFSIVVPMYTAATFLANGGLVKLTAGNGDMTIYDISYQIDRTHKAR